MARSSGSVTRPASPTPPGGSAAPAGSVSSGADMPSTNRLALRIFTASRRPILSWPGSKAVSTPSRALAAQYLTASDP